MNFLSALYLLGTAAVVAPIVIHMIRRAPRDNFKFSTLRFLSSSPETVSKRSKIQHWLLLLLRALAIILIALAFARPYFVSEDMAGEKENRAVVMFLVDQSASMNRKDVRDRLLKKLNERLDKVKATDHFCFSFYENISHVQVGFKVWQSWPVEERKAKVRQLFEKLRGGWAESNMPVSLRSISRYGG